MNGQDSSGTRPVQPEQAKAAAIEEVDQLSEMLIETSRQIFANPELCFEEYFAHDLLTSQLESAHLDVSRQAFGLDTAFSARAGKTGTNVAIICEYDALPDLGHACGHNIIAAAGLGAALAVAPLADLLGGRLTVLGTPAEEAGGGKEFMIRAGAFDDVDVAMMIHPADRNLPSLTTLAFQGVTASYRGLASHAAAAPERGRNALDAAVLGYNAIAALRQHIGADERIHGIFTDGGQKANIVPAFAQTQWYVRSGTSRNLELLKARVARCLEAGAVAAEVQVELDWMDPPYAEMIDNPGLLACYESNAMRWGRGFDASDHVHRVLGSTDMGNVSQIVPSIHPLIAVAPPGVSIHSEDFARYAGGAEGDAAVLDGAKALAMTTIDCWLAEGPITAEDGHRT